MTTCWLKFKYLTGQRYPVYTGTSEAQGEILQRNLDVGNQWLIASHGNNERGEVYLRGKGFSNDRGCQLDSEF